MADEDVSDLRLSVVCLTRAVGAAALRADWDDPDDVSLQDRRLRILNAYGRCVERCLKMTHDENEDLTPDQSIDIDALRADLYRRLARRADTIGADELARRLERQGIDPARLRLGGVAASGPDCAE